MKIDLASQFYILALSLMKIQQSWEMRKEGKPRWWWESWHSSCLARQRWYCCIAGEPSPSVYWYRNEKVLDASDMKTFDETVKNRIVLTNLRREDLNSRYESNLKKWALSYLYKVQQAPLFCRFRCLAVNNNITAPSETSLRLNIQCK